jgi:hypothetical protein
MGLNLFSLFAFGFCIQQVMLQDNRACKLRNKTIVCVLCHWEKVRVYRVRNTIIGCSCLIFSLSVTVFVINGGLNNWQMKGMEVVVMSCILAYDINMVLSSKEPCHKSAVWWYLILNLRISPSWLNVKNLWCMKCHWSRSFAEFSSIILSWSVNPLLPHTHLSLTSEVCDNADQAARYCQSFKFGTSSVTWHLRGYRARKLVSNTSVKWKKVNLSLWNVVVEV